MNTTYFSSLKELMEYIEVHQISLFYDHSEIRISEHGSGYDLVEDD